MSEQALCARKFALTTSPSSTLLCPQPQHALKDTKPPSEGLGIDEGTLGADSLGWCETGISAGDVSDDSFDSHSWHSDALSDLSLDSQDVVHSPLRLENVFIGQRLTSCNNLSGKQSKRQKEDPVSDVHRYTAETCAGQSTCCRRKSPENHLERYPSYKLCARKLDTVNLQHHPSEEKQRHDLHQENTCLQSICTETQAASGTELLRLKATAQCLTDKFGTRASQQTGRQGVCLQGHHGEWRHDVANTETCTIHIDTTEDQIKRKQQSTHGYRPRLESKHEGAKKSVHNASLDTFEFSNDPVAAENVESLCTCSVDKSTALNRCNSEHVDRCPRHIENSQGKCNLCKGSGMYSYGAQVEIKSSCTDLLCFSDEVIKQSLHSSCLPVNLRPTFGKEEAHGMKTSSTSDDVPTKPCDAPDTRAAISSTDTRCSQKGSERNRGVGLPEIVPQVFATVKGAQDNALVSGVSSHTEVLRPDSSTIDDPKQTRTVNEICSAITFTTQTATRRTLETCSTSQVSVNVKGSDRDLEGLIDNKLDHKPSHSVAFRSSQATAEELIKMGTSVKSCPRSLSSSDLETCDSNSGQCLSYQAVKHYGPRGEEEEAFCPLSDHSQGDGCMVRLSSCAQSEVSEQITWGPFPNSVTNYPTNHKLPVIEEKSTSPAASECIERQSPKCVDVASEVTPSAGLKADVDLTSSHCKKVHFELRFPESCSNQLLLADSNNNKATIKGAEQGDVVDWSAKVVQSNPESIEGVPRLPVELSEQSASDSLVFENTSLDRLEVFSPPLDFRHDIGREDSNYSLINSDDDYNHFSPGSVPQKLETGTSEDDYQSDFCFNQQNSSCLEPIMEAERFLENFAKFTDHAGLEMEREQRQTEILADHLGLLDDISLSKSTEQQPAQKEPLTDDHVAPAIISATATVCISGEKRHRPITVAYDTVSCNLVGSNSDAAERSHLSIWPRNSGSNKMAQRCKTKGNQTVNKASKFSVFAKMPSFRKSKASKEAKIEEMSQELSDGGDEGVLCEQEQPRDNAFDDNVVKNDILSQTVYEASSSSYFEVDDDECDFFSSSTSHSCLGGSEESGNKSSQNEPVSKHVQTPDGQQTCKRSKSNDSLNIRMRFAQAHKSLSSLFESRSTDKDGSEQALITACTDSDTPKPSWETTTQAIDVEHLKRTLSLPDGDCRNIARRQVLRDIISSPLLERHYSVGSASLHGTTRQADPTSKWDVPPGCVDENFHVCTTDSPAMHKLPQSFNDSGIPLSPATSPLSRANHSSPSTPANQVSAFWTRSHHGTAEDLAKSPVRPMSPKPNSPRPASQRKSFCFSHSVRGKSVSPVSLPQSVSIDGLTDPPKRPKTLKPSSSPLYLSLNPLDTGDSRVHNHSHIRLYANGSINELEVRTYFLFSSAKMYF